MDKFRIDKILIETLAKMLDQLTSFVPNLILAILIFVIGQFIAKTIRFIFTKVLKKTRIDDLGEKVNEIDFVKKFKIEMILSNLVPSILYYFMIILFLSAATEKLGVKVITDLVASITNNIFPFIAAFILLLVGLLIADVLQKIIVAACKSMNISSAKLIGSIVFFFIFIISLIAALGQAGINTTLLESSFSIIIAGVIFAFSLGYGIASKDVLANMISSFYSKNKFKEGQVIEIDGVRGEIISVDNTSISIKTTDSKTIIPLNLLQTKQVILFDK
jgi:Conserved TM helix/Mechanosensitive ion channel